MTRLAVADGEVALERLPRQQDGDLEAVLVAGDALFVTGGFAYEGALRRIVIDPGSERQHAGRPQPGAAAQGAG